MRPSPPRINLHLRMLDGEGGYAMGPGKALLLEAIRETGSISGAGRRLEMSYRKGRIMVNEMNLAFRAPLVEATKGGNLRGGASLTDLGLEVLARFREAEAAALAAAGPGMEALGALLARS